MSRAPKKQLEVIDFFCGAGGFSEGFRQQGFKVVMGVDNWRPAIESHNINHTLNDVPKDVLDFESLNEINALPNTEIIIGSPPCVLFSMSNRAGKADKSLGIRLIEAYLRVIAIKKHQKGSKLKAWFLENVPNSRKYIKAHYTFKDLGITEWAKEQGKNPEDVALEIASNSTILNAAEYGAPQKRQRFVCGEVMREKRFVFPDKTHSEYVRVKDIRSKLPSPTLKRTRKELRDPNYPSLLIPAEEITDHFYDTGVYEAHWRSARDYKINHPFMGRMSFPENEMSPSRTVMATRSASSRESLIYKSEYKRKGDGEYRTPTIREVACLMGFPLAYQFTGGESTKWAQIGNAVPTHLSAALAKTVRTSLGLAPIKHGSISFDDLIGNHDKIPNLNTYDEKDFTAPPQRKSQSRFRKHPFKDGNMTVALTNYDPSKPKLGSELSWHSSVFHGTGKGFALEVLEPGTYEYLEKIIISSGGELGKQFVEDFKKNFSDVLENVSKLQSAYENPRDYERDMNPEILVERIAEFISTSYAEEDVRIHSARPIAGRTLLPARQVYAMYALNRLISAV
ncbi:MAG: cytosine methyltransferase [Parcubacteria group bacterium]|nr:cytosine methyltransferase [Parcubacteria group bacterium]